MIMPNCRQHRQWILCNSCSHLIIIEARHIQFGTASAKDEHGIIHLSGIHHRIKGGNDRCRTLHALHQGRIELRSHLEGIRIFVKMADEVAVAGCVSGGNHRKVVRQRRHSQFLLQVHKTFRLKAFYSPLSLLFLQAERKFRIYIIDYQRKTIQLTVCRLDLHENHHAFLDG